jgi:hypothetical protein
VTSTATRLPPDGARLELAFIMSRGVRPISKQLLTDLHLFGAIAVHRPLRTPRAWSLAAVSLAREHASLTDRYKGD